MLTTKTADYDLAGSQLRSVLSGDTYQCELCIPGGIWTTVAAPFDHFVRVDRGHVTPRQRPTDDDGGSGRRGVNPEELRSVRAQQFGLIRVIQLTV